MAGKKPAKKPVATMPTAMVKVEEKGKPILYVGIGGVKFHCPSCDREFGRGMTYEHNNIKYCSKRCIG